MGGIKWAAVYGMALLKDYPYTARVGTCKIQEKRRYRVNKGVRKINRTNASLVAALSKKVTTVAIAAGAIRFYRGGVFSNWGCGTRLGHAVNAVGYGTDSRSGKMFYKIRNSWGSRWGENGYIRFERRNSGTGICGVTHVTGSCAHLSKHLRTCPGTGIRRSQAKVTRDGGSTSQKLVELVLSDAALAPH